jgi:hypothetical protein
MSDDPSEGGVWPTKAHRPQRHEAATRLSARLAYAGAVNGAVQPHRILVHNTLELEAHYSSVSGIGNSRQKILIKWKVQANHRRLHQCAYINTQYSLTGS